MKKSLLDIIVLILLIVGAINWGLIALVDINLVTLILGAVPALVRLTYLVVGVAGVYAILWLAKLLK